MNARFVEFNGRISITLDATTEHEMLLLKLFRDQCARTDLLPVQIVSDGSQHNDTPDRGYAITRRSIHFGQYSRAEVDSYKTADEKTEASLRDVAPGEATSP